MGIQPQIALYNQVHGTDENFVAAFVARLEVLETLVASLNVIVETGTSNHYMLVGPRGMGKSSLLRRLGIAITETDALNAHFMPLRFREEQYNVTSLAAFWGNCGEALADWAEQNDLPDLAAEMDSAIASPEWKDAAIAERQFRAACQKAGNRRPVLLVDNLDLIVDGIKLNEQWALRSALQSDGGPILIGAATQFLAQAADREAPFYEFFYPLVLEPLSETEMLACLRALAGARPKTSGPVLTILNQQPERLRTLYTLTGGNPRVLALIYLLLERAETETIFQDLEKLLDEVTPYYKSRVEEYQTAQQRAVIDAIALHWDPILSRGIAEATGIAPTTISGLLLKLRREGFIQEVQTSSAIAGYQISERFLNIWYLMRHGTRRTKLRLKWLSIFYSRFYSASELADMAQMARSDFVACRWSIDYREIILEAEALQKGETVKSPKGEFILRDAVQALFDKAFEHQRLGRNNEEIATYDELLEYLGDSQDLALQLVSLMILNNKGCQLGNFGRGKEAILVYDELIARFASSSELKLQAGVARAIINKAYEFGRMRLIEEEINLYKELVASYGASLETELQEMVAIALVREGIALGQLSRVDDELIAYNELVARFGNSVEPSLQVQVTKALCLKAFNLIEILADLSAADATLQQAIVRVPDDSSVRAIQTWLAIFQGQPDKAAESLARLQDLPVFGMNLLRASIEIASDNFGNGLAHLQSALEEGHESYDYDVFTDLLWLLRLCESRGYGQRILDWLAETGFADKYAPLTVAFNAYVKGERFLLDSNPEVRGAAKTLYDRMDRHRQYKAKFAKEGKAKAGS